MIYFFSMSTDFAKASLGAEGIKKYVPMLIGNGYYPGHAAIAFDIVRREEKLAPLSGSALLQRKLRRKGGKNHGKADHQRGDLRR